MGIIKPLISIITPLYNAESYIERAIKSVNRQTLGSWEHLIIDDCSTDNSYALVEKLALVDSRIKLLQNEKNSGAAVSRNRGIEAAKGRYIAFLDSDDQWLEKKLQVQLDFMKHKNINFSFSYYNRIDENGNPLGTMKNLPNKVDYHSTIKNNKIGCLTVMYDTNYFGKVYMKNIRKRQDFALWLELLRATEYAYCIPEILATYTIRPNSVSSNKLSLVKYHWNVYHNIEGHSAIKSLYYVLYYIYFRLGRNS